MPGVIFENTSFSKKDKEAIDRIVINTLYQIPNIEIMVGKNLPVSTSRTIEKLKLVVKGRGEYSINFERVSPKGDVIKKIPKVLSRRRSLNSKLSKTILKLFESSR